MKVTLEPDTSVEFLALPVDAIILVEVLKVEDKVVPGKDGKDDWTKLEFTFKIVDVPTALEAQYGILIGTKVWGSVSSRFTGNPDNKLRQWAESLLGLGELTEGFELDTDVLVGRKARAVIGQYKKRDGSAQHQVVGLLPMAAPVAALAPAAASSSPLDAYRAPATVGAASEEIPF